MLDVLRSSTKEHGDKCTLAPAFTSLELPATCSDLGDFFAYSTFWNCFILE